MREITWHNGLISSIPLRDLVKLITDIPPAIGHSATALKASPGCILNLGVKRLSIHGSKSWVYVADPNLSFYRFGFYSNIEPALAPEGYVSMYVEVTPKLHHHSDSEIQNRVLIDLHKMGIIVEEPVVIHLHRLSENYCLTSKHTLSILAFLRSQGIFSIGRYGAWRWSSQHEDILDAWELALHLRYTN